MKSIQMAHDAGSSFRSGPELELCGYSIEDALFEQDTIHHCWACLSDIIRQTCTWNIIIDIGMPVYNSSLYNCRVIIYKGKILLIRAKSSLARDGNYREDRHFCAWPRDAGVVPFRLPQFVSDQVDQTFVPFGSNFVLDIGSDRCDKLSIGWEICQELWDLRSVSAELYEDFGCHLVVNGSGSYWELRKLSVVSNLVNGLSLRAGACYAFSNHVGCDGQRYVFYGRSCIYDKGDLVAITPIDYKIFDEIQMITHTIDAKAIDEYRALMAIRPKRYLKPSKIWNLLNQTEDISLLDKNMKIFQLDAKFDSAIVTQRIPLDVRAIQMRFEQEIHIFVSLWLWDYLRRSRLKGFMMPLSGGLDSSCVAILVYSMCNYLYLNRENPEVDDYFTKIHNIDMSSLQSPVAICNIIMKCCYLSTDHSSSETLNRAKDLTDCIGAQFSEISIQNIYQNFRTLLKPQDSQAGVVSILDQNLQARLRMTSTYYLSEGNRIVLATGNVDEAIVGYLTKYDCSSADINPIGGLCKNDLKSYLKFCCESVYKDQEKLVKTLQSIIDAPPSAELTGCEQRDEDEIGLTYSEICLLGRLRKGILGCSGPRGAFETIWRNRFNDPYKANIECLKGLSSTKSSQFNGEIARKIANLVKRFYSRYGMNRHKLTVLTPALHAETYSPDDNRYDHRHFLYAPWTEQFKSIDELVSAIEND